MKNPTCVRSSVFALAFLASGAAAVETPVALGTAGNFAVLASTTITNVNSIGTVVTGDIGVWPGSAITGFPPGVLAGGGVKHEGDGVAMAAQGDLTTAYNDAAGRTPATNLPVTDLGGLTKFPGLYRSTSVIEITSGDLTLDAQGDSNAVFIFQSAGTLSTAPTRKVILIGGAQSSNVFWQVTTSATFDTTTEFAGVILAGVSVSFATGAKLDGRALARGGAVTLDASPVNPGGFAAVADWESY